MKRTSANSDSLNIKKVLGEFEEAERKKTRRKGSFKIDKPFEEALDKILQSKPEPNKSQNRRS